jgi:hypothetical protein
MYFCFYKIIIEFSFFCLQQSRGSNSGPLAYYPNPSCITEFSFSFLSKKEQCYLAKNIDATKRKIHKIMKFDQLKLG